MGTMIPDMLVQALWDTDPTDSRHALVERNASIVRMESPSSKSIWLDAQVSGVIIPVQGAHLVPTPPGILAVGGVRGSGDDPVWFLIQEDGNIVPAPLYWSHWADQMSGIP
jgi:hypothetical protein